MLGKSHKKEDREDYDSFTGEPFDSEAVSVAPSEPPPKKPDKKNKEPHHGIKCRNWLNLIFYLVNTVVTYFSLTGFFGGSPLEVSSKYQTLFTPAGWAFLIWTPIFIWEGIFIIAQFCYCWRHSTFVINCSPWWWGACICQTLWVLVFAQEWVSLAGLLMSGILNCLLGVAWSTDIIRLTYCEWWLLKIPLSLHLGWIVVASLLSLNVQADGYKSTQRHLLALAVLSYGASLATVAVFALKGGAADPIVCLVVAWAFCGIYVELRDPVALDNPLRYNPSIWDRVTLGGMEDAAWYMMVISLIMALVAAFRNIFPICCPYMCACPYWCYREPMDKD